MKISVIVPVLNEEQSIRGLLDGLLSQSLCPDEIVITDGGSSDGTPLIIAEYAERHAGLRLLREPHALPGRGRNLAVANSSGEWLAFIDAGVVPAADWLAQLAKCATQDRTVDIVFGSWEPVTDTFFKECAAIAYARVPDRENHEEVKRARAIFSTLMRRSVWQRVGGFPEDLRSAEDLLFIRKIDEQGFPVAYAPAALVSWTMQPTFNTTGKRFAVYSRNNLAAGLWRQWQAATLGRYVVLLLCAAVLSLFTRWWPIVAGITFLLMFLGRAVVALARNRGPYPAPLSRNLKRLTVIVPILITIDAATILGTVNWLVRDRLRLFRD